VVPSAAGTTTLRSMIADPVFTCQTSSAILRKRLVQSCLRRVDLYVVVRDVDLNAIAIKLDQWIQRPPSGTRSTFEARAGSIKPGSGAETPR
jgi:hypothetical protein